MTPSTTINKTQAAKIRAHLLGISVSTLYRRENPEQYRKEKIAAAVARIANPEKRLKNQKTVRSNKEPIDRMILSRFHSMKARAKKHGMGFNITKAYLKTLLKAADMTCEFTGDLLTTKIGNWNVVSFDRIVNTRGYVYGNIQVVSSYGNTVKLDKSMEEFKSWVAKANAHLNG